MAIRVEANIVPPGARLRGLQSRARELDEQPVQVQGRLPEWLCGDLLLNGPALWDLPGGSYRHWFDGLAMLHRVHLGPDGPTYRSRYLRSQDYLESTAAGRPAYGAFGTPEPETPLLQRLRQLRSPRGTDNGAVVLSRMGQDWVAQTETPLVTAFDPHTLQTLGRVVFDDRETLHMMSAHGITEDDGTYWNVGITLGPTCTYHVFRVPPGSRRREVLARVAVRKPGYLHALALTPRHVVFWEPAWRAQALQFLFSTAAHKDKFRWEPEGGSRIHRVARQDGQVQSWDVPPLMAFHAVQAYEEDGDTVLELCVSGPQMVEALALEALRAGRPVTVPHVLQRYRLSPGSARAEPEAVLEGAELPVVHGSRRWRERARYAWSAGLDPGHKAPLFDRTLKLDLVDGTIAAAWQRAPGAVQLEPLMVERPGARDEEDGVLLVPTLNDTEPGTAVAVLDPATMQCLATLHLPQVVPFGFHAAWKPAGPGPAS